MYDCLVCLTALMYSGFGVLMSKLRGAEDELNTIIAGTSTGLLYKSSGIDSVTCISYTVIMFIVAMITSTFFFFVLACLIIWGRTDDLIPPFCPVCCVVLFQFRLCHIFLTRVFPSYTVGLVSLLTIFYSA